jgi:hypothetical protein
MIARAPTALLSRRILGRDALARACVAKPGYRPHGVRVFYFLGIDHYLVGKV